MTWLPHFLNWPIALGVAGAAIPALLVLYFLKLRRREMAVSSTILWRKAIQDLQVNAPFQKLRRNLLLLLQLLLLLFLLLALSRPVANYTPGPGKTTVILIDRSASMACKDVNGHSRLDEAKKRALDLVAGMKRDATAMVIAFDDSAEMLQAFTSDQNLLRNAVDSIKQTDRKTDLRLAYQLADAQSANYNPEQLRPNTDAADIVLYSDGRVLNENDLTVRGNVTYEKLGDDKSGNVGIVSLSAKRNYERPTEVQVFARLANFGPDPVAAGVQLSVDGERIDTEVSKLQDTFLLPERWTEDERTKYEEKSGQKRSEGVEFKLKLTQAAVIKVEQTHKEGDMLAADDIAQVIVPAPKTLSVLLVTDGNYFLERAVRSLNLNKPQIMRPTEYEEKYNGKPPTEFDVILFDNYVPPTDPKTGKTQLPEAGNFIWFREVPDGIKTKVATEASPATRRAGAAAAPPDKNAAKGKPIILEDVGVLDWKREHPILANLALNKLYIAEALKLDVPLDREVLVDGLKGPLVVLDREDKQTHLIVAFDVLQSNWPLKVSFPVFLDNAMQFLALGAEMSVRQSYDPGSTPRIPRSNLQRAGEGLTKINLDGPGGRRVVPVPPSGDFVLPALDKVGVYSTDPPIPQYEQLAVNLLDANESNVLPNPDPPGKIGKVESTGSVKSRLELWWWLAAGALALLFVEWWVYTRRVHL
jgi:hypothetical protein